MPRLPLFPLDLVLFPGTQAPLHIFEPRFRALLRDVLAVDGTLGIILPTAEGLPLPGAIGVAARVVSHQPLSDGRSNLLVRGESRFVLAGILTDPAPYPVAEVEFFDDDPLGSTIEADTERQLRALAERCRKAMATLADVEPDSRWSSDPALLSFQAAAALPWDPAQAAPVLGMRRADERAALLLRVLPGIVPELEQRAAVHLRAGTNGKGPHGHTTVSP